MVEFYDTELPGSQNKLLWYEMALTLSTVFTKSENAEDFIFKEIMLY